MRTQQTPGKGSRNRGTQPIQQGEEEDEGEKGIRLPFLPCPPAEHMAGSGGQRSYLEQSREQLRGSSSPPVLQQKAGVGRGCRTSERTITEA